MLYNSVPTDAHELDDFHNTISNHVVPTDNVFITPAIIAQCLTLYDPGGGGFKSPPPRFFALTHLILELYYCALVTFPKK